MFLGAFHRQFQNYLHIIYELYFESCHGGAAVNDVINVCEFVICLIKYRCHTSGVRTDIV